MLRHGSTSTGEVAVCAGTRYGDHREHIGEHRITLTVQSRPACRPVTGSDLSSKCCPARNGNRLGRTSFPQPAAREFRTTTSKESLTWGRRTTGGGSTRSGQVEHSASRPHSTPDIHIHTYIHVHCVCSCTYIAIHTVALIEGGSNLLEGVNRLGRAKSLFGDGQIVQRGRLFPYDAIDALLKLSIVWSRPNHGFRAFGRAMTPSPPP